MDQPEWPGSTMHPISQTPHGLPACHPPCAALCASADRHPLLCLQFIAGTPTVVLCVSTPPAVLQLVQPEKSPSPHCCLNISITGPRHSHCGSGCVHPTDCPHLPPTHTSPLSHCCPHRMLLHFLQAHPRWSCGFPPLPLCCSWFSLRSQPWLIWPKLAVEGGSTILAMSSAA
jgi:hypothetical protein